MRYSQKQRALCKTERQKFEHGVNQDKEKRVFCLDENVRDFYNKHTEFIGRDHRNSKQDFDNTLDWNNFLTRRINRYNRMMRNRQQFIGNSKYYSREQIQWNMLINTFKNVLRHTTYTSQNNQYQKALLCLNNLLR